MKIKTITINPVELFRCTTVNDYNINISAEPTWYDRELEDGSHIVTPSLMDEYMLCTSTNIFENNTVDVEKLDEDFLVWNDDVAPEKYSYLGKEVIGISVYKCSGELIRIFTR